MSLSRPGRGVSVREALRHPLVELAGSAGDDVRPTADLTDLEVVFMAGEDEAHAGAVEHRLQRLAHLLVVLVIGSGRIDRMVRVRDEPAIPVPAERRTQPLLVLRRLEVAVNLLLFAVE